jgi:hypothetical protein
MTMFADAHLENQQTIIAQNQQMLANQETMIEYASSHQFSLSSLASDVDVLQSRCLRGKM